MLNRRSLIAGLAAGIAAPCLATPSRADLEGDIAILREALALHPGLYRYASPRDVEARIAAMTPAFIAAPDLATRYLVLSRFMATIRCGHSYCNFFNQKNVVAADLFDRPTRLPFRFRWIDRRMIVTGDPEKLDLAPGTEIAAIDGVAAPAMLAALLPYARADGGNDGKRIALMGMEAFDTIEYFDVFHGLVYGAPAGGMHQLAVVAPDGTRRVLDVPALDLAQRRATMAKRDYRGDQPVWDWTVRPDGVAVLTMPGWALYNSKWNWRAWLDDRLNSLGGAKGLMIDLRENEGGQDCGDYLLARLVDRPLALPGAERRLRFRRTPASIDRYLDTWDDSFRTLGVDAVDLGNGFYRQTGEMADDAIRPDGKRLTLPVAALIGPTNSSATFQFADKARRSERVRLFGSTTGGNQRGINGGCYFFVRLPASGLEFDLPLVGYFPPGSPPDVGIEPHVHIAASAADIAASRDPVLDAAVNWAKHA